jgi:hypothetical protein
MGSAVRPPARCRRGQAQPATKRAARFGGHGFLNHTFGPVWAFDGDRRQTERQFFHSLNYLHRYYHLLPLATWPVHFPQNVYGAWQTVRGMLEEIDNDLECLIVADENRQAVLATAQTLRLNGLYYIPVRAFWEISGCAAKHAEADTLLHLFAYLHQQAGVPFYQQSGSFMDEQYETLETWITDAREEEGEEETAYRDEQLAEMYRLRQAGAHLMPLLAKPELLANLHEVVARNSPLVPAELAAIAERFSDLYRQYPELTLYDNIHTDLLYPGGEETVRPDQYTGFYWSPYDDFADQLDEMINCAFQEIAVVEEPVALIVFDHLPQPPPVPPLDYERRLYALMDDLRDYLMKLENEKHNREF